MRMVSRRGNRKVPTNVSVRADLVRRAKRLGINLSGLLESALEEAIRKVEREEWLAENKDAIEAYNRHVEKHGLFSDQWRKF
jgi:antitoxin CcdA